MTGSAAETAPVMETATSWGRTERVVALTLHPVFASELVDRPGAGAMRRLPVGLRRSYGTTVLPEDEVVLDLTGLDRLVAFDPETRILKAGAGLSLDRLMRWSVPRGLFPATVPGTRFVTLGGAVANDVHGKNHASAGSFGRAVTGFTLLRSDRGVVRVDRETEPELFAATVGGLGLTGVILDVSLRLVPISSSDLMVETVPFGDFADFLALSEESLGRFEHSVAWVDCTARGARLGRGLFERADRAETGGLVPHDPGRGVPVPFDAPSMAMSRAAVSAFNRAHYARGRRKAGRVRTPYAAFFHPLDGLRDWNRLYGRNGFRQYQCVVPNEAAEAVAVMLDVVSGSDQGSFLAVLKRFGPIPGEGMLSFPMPGVTLALDFRNDGASTLALLDRLDAIVREARGRLYPAKDGRMSPAMFRAGYPALEDFTRRVDPLCGSRFWRRMTA